MTAYIVKLEQDIDNLKAAHKLEGDQICRAVLEAKIDAKQDLVDMLYILIDS